MRRAGSGLARPAAACALLLICALLLTCTRAAAAPGANTQVAPGVCQSIDVRNTLENMHKLRGCRVIEGHLSIVVLERLTPKQFANISFPELREVTGYVVIYRMRGVRNLGDIFPNLSVIRGMELFKDFALVIFDCQDFEVLGLRSLTTIERGSVRIQSNDHLCYANTIDWGRIVPNRWNAGNLIRSNYDTRMCGLCPNAQSQNKDHPSCAIDNQGRHLCWDDKHCQKVCPLDCGENPCRDDGRTCCHRECLGGCTGPSVKDCYVCRHYSVDYAGNRTCVASCPLRTYALFRRCVSEEDCRKQPPPVSFGRLDPNQPTIQAYKIHNGTCVWTCPIGYMEEGTVESARCVRCPVSGCARECPGGKIDSIGSLGPFTGCTVINGELEISIRATGSNTMSALEAALGEVRVINGSLKVTRSTPLVSLMFLKNLHRIDATNSNKTNNKYSLNIFGNPNLELLWEWEDHRKMEIKGPLYVHFNPKLCYRLIEDLKNFTHSNFTEMEVSSENNGYEAPCFKQHLSLSVQTMHKDKVILKWGPYCTDDARKLLGYSIYYIAAEQNVTQYEQRDACSDTWNVLDIASSDTQRNDSKPDQGTAAQIAFYKNPCKDLQPVFYPITKLTPFTRYAAYVKTYTIKQDRKGAQSDIIYFKTLPGKPSPPRALSVSQRGAGGGGSAGGGDAGDGSVTVSWLPPALPNGTITVYHVEVQANQYNRDTILAANINYCNNPNQLASLISVPSGEEGGAGTGAGAGGARAEPPPADARNGTGTCACRADDKPQYKFNSQAEEERRDSIQFENELQNVVYIKTNKNSTKLSERPGGGAGAERGARGRRSVDDTSLLSTLVILSGNTPPTKEQQYFNSTDEAGYVKSLYYELDGKSGSLTIRNLRHFTWYTVNVWACRDRQANETTDDYLDTWCSARSYHTFRTLKMMSADMVRDVHVVKLASNKTLPDLNVTWTPPRNPNGFVVAYNVHYAKVDDSSQAETSLQNCIIASECKNATCGTVLRNLLPGNYSVRVTPITLSGAGNVSAQAFVFIEERAAGHDWIWGMICGGVVLLGVVGAGLWYAKRGLLQPAEANKLFASVNPEYVSTVYVPDEWEVPRASIEFIRELGQGSFGMVYEGLAKGLVKGTPETRCAVKTVNEHATDRERIEFLNEASVMKAFDTFHVVRLLGVVSRGQPTLVVMELMECGDLKTYLRSHRPDADGSLPKKEGNNPPTLQNILQMAIEIADGMAYLSAKKFVHRDLAARNCMVAGDLTVKVGDFGMTRDIYETDYYRKGTKGLLPVRWMSPESLKDGVFSSNSDAWSYGVVLWEMATLAMQPYQGLSNEQVVRYVVEGGVMERPEHCPDRLYELMRACWAHRPAHRPAFLQLVAQLAPHAQPHFRHRSFFHSPHGQELYQLIRNNTEEEPELSEVNVGAVATGSGSNLFGVSGRLASWVRELSSLRSRHSDDAAAEPLQPAHPAHAAHATPLTPTARPIPLIKSGPNGILRDAEPASAGSGC